MPEEKKICSECGEEIEDDDYEVTEDGEILCGFCWSENYRECIMCGKATRISDMSYWGDELICPECLEGECPTVDEEDQDRETDEAYRAMLARYVGRRASGYRGMSLRLTGEMPDEGITYSITVDFDDEGVIVDVSRLSAERVLSEWVNGSDVRSYPVYPDDYGELVDDMLEEIEFDE